MQNLRFSLSTDASNKGNVKLFPVVIKYFNKNEGIVNFVLDLYDDANEKSIDIYNNITRILKSYNLSISNVIAYGADNASLNYGIHKSVYVNLQNENNCIVKGNCNCHIIHNTAKYGLMKIPVDIENLVYKLYDHFKISAKRVDQLKSCYEFCDYEYTKLLQYTPTRWLSLYKAIDRLILNYDAIKSYFIGVDSKDCENIIVDFIRSKSAFKNCDLTMFDVFIHFGHHYMELFTEYVLKLEKRPTNAAHLYDIMHELRVKIKNRIEEKFFGIKVREYMKNLSNEEKQQIITPALEAYNRTLEYLEDRFDYDKSIFKYFSALNFDTSLNFDKFETIAHKLHINIDANKLFDEITVINEVLAKLTTDEKNLENDKLWSKILMENYFPNIQSIVVSFMHSCFE